MTIPTKKIGDGRFSGGLYSMPTNTATTGAPANTSGGTTVGRPPLTRANTMPRAPRAPSTPAASVNPAPPAVKRSQVPARAIIVPGIRMATSR